MTREFELSNVAGQFVPGVTVYPLNAGPVEPDDDEEVIDCEEGECDDCNDPECGCDCHDDGEDEDTIEDDIDDCEDSEDPDETDDEFEESEDDED